MLQKLQIQNYALIENLSIDFSSQLNIITGETGAGKSILMGALNLILGQRADSAVLLDKTKKCIVEGYFTTKDNEQVKEYFEKYELDSGDEILLRREIAATGKSRSFINDTPVNLGQLKELAVLLVDLHQQFDTLELGNENFQREVIDALAENKMLLRQMRTLFIQYAQAKKNLEVLQQQQADANKELDYNRFLFDELNSLSLKENELEALDTELKVLSNAEGIKQDLNSIYYEMADSEQPLLQQLKVLQQKLNALADFHPDLPALNERMNSSIIELKDIATELERIDEGIQYDAERIQVVNDRIAAGYKLLKKHNVTTTGELLEIQEKLEERLDEVLNISNHISRAEQETRTLFDECNRIAAEISGRRSKVLKAFTTNTNKLLTQVGMPNARLSVTLEKAAVTETGSDAVQFLFDGNKSDRFEPLHKVASGGELSRLMLSIKSLVARKLQLPTLIFDEIDTGISGEAARQVGQIMKDLSQSHQLIAITHQPQIAARATAHFFVYKGIVKDKIVTAIQLLNDDERITAIARMLSGEKPTAAALANAREMVGN